MSDLVTQESNKQLEITEKDGKTTIVFRKAILKGKVSSSEVLNTILIAAKLQAEYYIKKLSHGAPLETSEVKSLKELAEITKLEVSKEEKQINHDNIVIDTVKSNLYNALAERLSQVPDKVLKD